MWLLKLIESLVRPRARSPARSWARSFRVAECVAKLFNECQLRAIHSDKWSCFPARNLPDRRAVRSPRRECWSRRFRHCKSFERGLERRIRRVLSIRHSIGYRSLRETNRSTISGGARPLRPLLPVHNARGIFRPGPRKFSNFRAHAKLSIRPFVCPLAVRVSYSDAGNFGGIFRQPSPTTAEYRGELSEIVFNALQLGLRGIIPRCAANGKVFMKSGTYIFLSMWNIGRASAAKASSLHACANRRVISAPFKRYQAGSCKFLRAFKVSYSTDGSEFRGWNFKSAYLRFWFVPSWFVFSLIIGTLIDIAAIDSEPTFWGK